MGPQAIDHADAERRLRTMGAIVGDHLVGTQGKGNPRNGLHMRRYVDKDVATSNPQELSRLCQGIAWLMQGRGVAVIVSPPMGALSAGTLTAYHMGVSYAYLDPAEPHPILKRPHFCSLVEGQQVGVVDDVLNLGGTALETIQAVDDAGGIIAAVSALCNRGFVTAQTLCLPADAFMPLVTLDPAEMETFTLDECAEHGPCSEGIPIRRRPGHGYQLEAVYPYPGGYID